MTYSPFLANPDANKTQSTLGVPADLNVNTRIPCTAVTHTGITNSNGQLVISSGLSVLLTASAFITRRVSETDFGSGGYMIFQWYDVTNSVWLGKDCQISTAIWNDDTHRYKSESFARCVLITTGQTTVELRIKSILNCTAINERYDGSSISTSSWPSPWYSILSF